MSTATLPADPVELIRQLDPAALRARLEQLERERMALLALLRAAIRSRPREDSRG
jgi:hypothetical protein